MPGLQDLLLLRQLRDQADPFKSAFASLAQGVSEGIETGIAEQKAKKKKLEDNEMAITSYSRAKGSTNASKAAELIPKLTQKADGTLEYTATTPTPSQTALRRKTELEADALERSNTAISAFLEPGSTSTEIDLLRAGIDPTDVKEMVKIKNVAQAKYGQEDVVQQPGTPISRGTPIKGTTEATGDGRLIPKAFDVEKQIPKDVVDVGGIKEVGAVEAQIKGEAKQVLNWNDEAAQRQIKVNVANPKLNYFMDIGGRAYQELKTEAKDKLGVELDFTKGGVNFYKNALIKKGLGAAKLTPLMTALDRLRPELGVELMRQLGAFRSAQMAKTFEKTLAQFSGNIKEDIANMTTTIAKNAANTELLDEQGNVLPNEVRDQKMVSVEANLIRRYNYMYRNMGLMDKPYLAQRSFDWIAGNSTFTEGEEGVIGQAMEDNPGYSKTSVAAKLIEQGLL